MNKELSPSVEKSLERQCLRLRSSSRAEVERAASSGPTQPMLLTRFIAAFPTIPNMGGCRAMDERILILDSRHDATA
jgi:hypothetical protein